MRILEVRDGFIKFETDKKYILSSFLEVTDSEKSYIAQVVQAKRIGEYTIVYAKLIFLYDGDLQNYDKSLPSKDSEIKNFDYNTLTQFFNYEKPVVIGSFPSKEEQILINSNSLTKTLICVDNPDNKNIVVNNIAKQFEKSLVIDTSGTFSSSSKFIAGTDFKLPLNTNSLQFIFEDCLTDATSESKSLIKEIFQDLSDYSKTVQFLPFSTLKTIVDDMVDKSHVFKLLVLKNKLAKFDKLGYFASSTEEVKNLNNVLNSKYSIIDLSKLDSVFQNRYLEIILSTLKAQEIKTQIFVETSNVLNKRNLRDLFDEELSVTFVSHSKYRYLNDIKSMFTNYIIEPNFVTKDLFKSCSSYLNSMEKNEYLIIGEGTNYLPLVSIVKEVNFASVLENGLGSTVSQSQVFVEESGDDSSSAVIMVEENSESLDEVTVESIDSNVEELSEEDLQEDVIAQDEVIVAIEERSDSVIEQVSEEINSQELNSDFELFENEDTYENFIESVDENLDIEQSELDEQQVLDYESEQITSAKTNLESENQESIDKDDLETPLEFDGREEALDEELESENIEITDDDFEGQISTEETESSFEEFHTEVDSIQMIEMPEDISILASEDDSQILPSVEQENLENEDVILQDSSEEFVSLNSAEEYDAFIELDEAQLTEDDIIVDFDEDSETLSEEDIDKAIVEDVDKVFTTMKDDTISDSDLDFIDELNGNIEVEEVLLPDGMEELTELQEEDSEDLMLQPIQELNDLEDAEDSEILETRSSTTPMVPVYGADIPAEDVVMSDVIEQGDLVVHAKYGNGVVEKMIKYGTKTLYSINFDNVGRRLLDPTLTEIKKA